MRFIFLQTSGLSLYGIRLLSKKASANYVLRAFARGNSRLVARGSQLCNKLF